MKTKQQIADTVCTAVQSVIVWKTCNRFVRDNVEGQRLQKLCFLKLSCLVLHVLRSCCLPYLSLSFSFRKSSIKRIALLVAMARLMSRPKFSVSLNVRMSSFEP